jgi:predicted HTH transcriptional regulator
VWETYSSFANTMGGIILLGVDESKDKSFRAVDLPAPEKLIEKFWRLLNDPRHVSVNILTKKHVRAETVGGKRIVVIEVPRAHRADKPVYIENNPISGTYRRGGEGDYRCTPAEIEAMRRDAASATEDMQPLAGVYISALDATAIRAYRAEMQALRPGHILEQLDDTEFLLRIGAAERDRNGEPRPTAAGLLTFGFAAAIRECFPSFTPRFTVCENALEGRKCHTVLGVNTQNLYYFRQTVTLALDAFFPRSPTAREALSEALVNCIVNADYLSNDAISVTLQKDAVRLQNPGAFRMDPKAARAGGVSDSRNKGLARLFSLIGAGTGVGGGIPRMFALWRRGGRPTPYFEEGFEPERITLVMPLQPKNPETGEKNATLPKVAAKQMIAEYLTARITASAADIASSIGLSLARTHRLLAEMSAERITVAEGTGKSTLWRLREKAGL